MYKNITSPWHALEAFKQDMRNKYGDKFKGSQLTDEELEIYIELKSELGKQEKAFRSDPNFYKPKK